MRGNLAIDVGSLDAGHRRALEEVMGRPLSSNDRLFIEVEEIDVRAEGVDAPAQSIDGWTKIYDGLSEQEIESIDKIAKTRANLSRDLF
jgi:hypothetical protein